MSSLANVSMPSPAHASHFFLQSQHLLPLKRKAENSSETQYPIVSSLKPNSLNDPSTLLPYRIVRYMATTCLEPFVKGAMKSIFNETKNEKEASTSCICNLIALTIIFAGHEKTKLLMERVRLVKRDEFNVKLPDKSHLPFFVDNFISSQTITALRNIFHDRDNFANDYTLARSPFVTSLFADLNPIVEKILTKASAKTDVTNEVFKKLTNAFREFKYDFNESIISSLKFDLCLNTKIVNQQTSIIYLVTIHVPFTYEFDDSKPISKEQQEFQEKTYYYHAFIIEQFRGISGILHRLHQTWEGGMTLLQYYQKMGYDNEEKGCLTLDEMLKFVNNLKLIVSPIDNLKDPLKPKTLSEMREGCFGYESKEEPIKWFFEPKKRVFKGMSMRFQTCEFNPSESLEKYNAFIRATKK